MIPIKQPAYWDVNMFFHGSLQDSMQDYATSSCSSCTRTVAQIPAVKSSSMLQLQTL